jgi:hypothetical protein
VRRPGPGKKRSGESDRPEMVKVALLIVNLARSALKTAKISDQTKRETHAAHATAMATAMLYAAMPAMVRSRPARTQSHVDLWAGSLSVSRSPGRARHAAHGRPTVADTHP